MCFLFTQESGHALFAVALQVFDRRLFQRLLCTINLVPLPDEVTGEVGALVAEAVKIQDPFLAVDDAALVGAKVGLILIRAGTADTGVILFQRVAAHSAIESAGGEHFRCKHNISPFTRIITKKSPLSVQTGTLL